MRAIDIIMSKKFGRGKKGMVIGWPELLKVAGGTATDIVGATPPITLEDAIKGKITKLIQYGLCSQADTPTPSSPVDIMCNNGAVQMVDDELPIGYKRLTGIRFDGNVWYETGEALTGADEVTMTLDNTASQGQNVFGSYNGTASGSKNFSLFIYGNGSSSNSYFRYGEQLLRPRFGTGERTITFGKNGTDGFATDATATPDSFETPANAYIGMLPNSTSPAYTGDIKGNITAGTRLKWIPSERAADGVIGYYEAVKGNFIGPSGTGTPTSLGYDGSHYSLAVVGTPEALSIAPIGSATQGGTPAPDNYVPVVGTKCGDATLYAIGSIRDTYDPITQTITRYIGSYTFTGEESFTSSTAYGKALLVNAASSAWGADRTESVLCNYFVSGTATSSAPEGTCFFNQTGHFYFRTTDSATDFKAWLASKAAAGTPLVVYFVRSSPTTEAYTGTPVGQTATAPNLFAVGDYADEVEIISGGVTRRVGITILTGEETGWALSDSGTTHRFRGVKPSDCHTPASRAPSVCTHFKYVSTGSAVGGMFIGASQYWYFIPTDQTIDTVDEWTAWLKAQYAAGTPVIVIYPLKEETTEQTAPQSLHTSAGDNVISVTANVSPIEFDVTYMKGA